MWQICKNKKWVRGKYSFTELYYTISFFRCYLLLKRGGFLMQPFQKSHACSIFFYSLSLSIDPEFLPQLAVVTHQGLLHGNKWKADLQSTIPSLLPCEWSEGLGFWLHLLISIFLWSYFSSPRWRCPSTPVQNHLIIPFLIISNSADICLC